MRTAHTPLILLIALALVTVALPASATSPQPEPWSPAILEGNPTAIDGLHGALFVAGTSDAGSGLSGQAGAPCTSPGGDADLYLFNASRDRGCVDALDVSGTETGAEGIHALAAAPLANRVFVSVNTSQGPNATPAPDTDRFHAYTIDDETLTRDFNRKAPGPITHLATNPQGTRIATITETNPENRSGYQLRIHDADGLTLETYNLPGRAHALAMSPNGNHIAAGGGPDGQGGPAAWVGLWSPKKADDANPRIALSGTAQASHGPVTSVAATNTEALLAGSIDGTVTHARFNETPQRVSIPNQAAPAYVDASPLGANLVAAAGNQIARLTATEDNLSLEWSHELDHAATGVKTQGRYAVAFGANVTGFNHHGTQLWTAPGGTHATLTGNGVTLAHLAPGPALTPAEIPTTNATANRIHKDATLTQQGNRLELAPGSLGVTRIDLENTGAAIFDGRLSPGLADALRGQSLTKAATYLPGDNQTHDLLVRAHDTAEPGTATIPVGLESRPRIATATPIQVDIVDSPNHTLTLRTETLPGLESRPGLLPAHKIAPGESLTLGFLLTNTGPNATDFNLTTAQHATSGPDWSTSFTPGASLTVEPDTTQTLWVEVQAPQTAAKGVKNALLVSAQAPNGTMTEGLVLETSAVQRVSITPATMTKKIAPGTQSSYTFEISNTGSLEAKLTLDARAVQPDGSVFVPSDWGVALSASRLNVTPGASESVTLDLTAPQDPETTANPNLQVQLRALIANQVQAEATAFGVADPGLAEEPNEEPLPLVAPLAALILAGFVAKRRTS